MTKIFGIGATGLIGSKVSQLLKENFEIDNLSTETGFDIRNPQTVERIIGNDKYHSIVIQFAAKTDVDGCELDKEIDEEMLLKGEKEQENFFQNNATAWAINVYGTKNVIEACKKGNKKLIYISTDYVFDGKNPPEGGYKEDDETSPEGWYGTTKLEGENLVRDSGIDYLILRTSFPFRLDEFPGKKDFYHIFLDLLQKGDPFKVIADAKVTPTYIDDFSEALKILIEKEANEIFHIVGSQSLTAYEAVQLMADKLGFNKDLIGKNYLEDFYKGRAPRPKFSVLNNSKISGLGVKMRRFDEIINSL